uniref:Uncharacterized protein n=1 Tax=Fagus sylvatica TaxID=28930 RepID=A0A2N9F160_FAGSY
MSIQNRTVNLGLVLETFNPLPIADALPSPPPPPSFIKGEKKVVKRKKGRRRCNARTTASHSSRTSQIPNLGLQRKIQQRPSHSRRDDFVMKNTDSHRGLVANTVGKSLLLPKDMVSWQENNFERLIENLKRHSMLSIQGIFEVSSKLLETEHLLREALGENALLKELEKMASSWIQAAKSNHKSATRAAMKKAEYEGQAYYDQGFNEATESLKSQLGRECNHCFLQGWDLTQLLEFSLPLTRSVDPEGRDEDFLVITGNWRNPIFRCPLTPRKPDKELTENKTEFVERKTVEYLLKKLFFVDCRGYPRSAPILSDYVPSYNTFQDKHSTPPPTADALPSLPPPPGFIKGEKKVAKRKRGEEDVTQEQQLVIPAEPLKSPILASKEKSNTDRATRKGRTVDRDDSIMKNKDDHGGLMANAVGKSLLLPKDMASWQENNSEHLIENLKCHSVLSIQGIFEVSSRLLETEHLLCEALGENALLKELEKTTSTWIQAVDSNHKSVEAGLKSVQRQASRAAVKQAEEEGQAYYDQGFNEATESLKSQLGRECNCCFLQGWDLTQL